MTSAAQRRAGADKGAEKSAHRAADKAPVYQVLAEDIKAMGVEAVFGLMSDDTALFATALDTAGVRFYGARHENTAIAMADGYAYATGRLGVAVVGRGPALANGLHAAVYASRTGSSLLIIYGEAATGAPAERARARLQGVRRRRRAEGRGTAHLLGDEPAVGARGARRCGRGGHGRRRGQPAPADQRAARRDRAARRAAERSGARAHAGAGQAAVDRRGSGGARQGQPAADRCRAWARHRAGARKAIEQLADRIGALIVTTARGKDLFRGNPNSLGIIGSFSHSIARRMADQADCVLVFGAGLNFLTTSFGTSLPQVPLIQVDTVRSNIGRWLNADVARGRRCPARRRAADRGAARAARRGQALPRRGDAQADRGLRPAQDFQPANTARTLDPRTLALELEKLLPQDRNLVVDGGNFLGVVPYLSVPDPGAFKMIGEFASIGLGFGAALGVAKGRPDSTTVLVVGDGGFLMTMGELETVVREDLPMVIVLMNDCAYGAELHFLKLRQQPVGKSVFPDVDFAPIAEASASRPPPSARSRT